jgi:predicted dehydrogenase
MIKTPSDSLNHVASAGNAPRIALIGCGAIAEEYYLPALIRHPLLLKQFVLVDRDEVRVQSIAEKFKVLQYVTDYRHVVGKIDGAILAVPTHLHYPISMDLLSQGVNVLCEKPLAPSIEQARELVKNAERNKKILAVNYLQRLIPSFEKVKEILVSKVMGEPLQIVYLVGEEFKWPTVSGFYFNSPLSSRGVLRDRGAHVMDHICWWLNDKPKVISSQNDSFGGSEAVAYVRFKHNRCLGEVRLSWIGTFPSRYEIKCEAGSIKGDVYDYHNIVIENSSGGKERIHLKAKEKTKIDIADKILVNFVNGMIAGIPPLISGGEVLDSIEFIDECYKAAIRFDMPWYRI